MKKEIDTTRINEDSNDEIDEMEGEEDESADGEAGAEGRPERVGEGNAASQDQEAKLEDAE